MVEPFWSLQGLNNRDLDDREKWGFFGTNPDLIGKALSGRLPPKSAKDLKAQRT
jgi:hypothetical protein